MNGSKSETGTGTVASTYPDWDVGTLVEQIASDLGGTYSRSTIRQELMEVASKYESGRIQTYVPILVHRETVERLRDGPAEGAPDNTPKLTEDLPTLPGTYGQVGGRDRAEPSGTRILPAWLGAVLTLLRITI